MESWGFDPKASEAVRAETDVHLAKTHGFGWRDRFADSMVRAYKAMESRVAIGAKPIPERERHIYEIGMSVFTHRYMPLPGALSVLQALRPNYNIAVVTKGDEAEQLKKIKESGVVHFVDQSIVVNHKNDEDWRNVFFTLGLTDLENHWAIGNSVKSDVNVPVRMGANGIHVDQGGWSFEKEDYASPLDGRKLYVVPNIAEVLNHIPWS